MKKSSKFLIPIQLLALAIISACSNGVETGDNFEIVELPDSSRVYLNHNSSVTFDEDFEERKITVDGEVYLSVTEGKGPFTVVTEQGEIEVLGTEFCIHAHGDNLEIEVEEGSVELKTAGPRHKITRGQRAVFVLDGGEITLGKAEFKFRVWLGNMEVEFKNHGRPFKHPHKYYKFKGRGNAPFKFPKGGPPPHARGRGNKKGFKK